MLDAIELMAFPLLAIDDLRNGFMPVVLIALHDDVLVDGTKFEKSPMCAFSAAAIPDPPAMDVVEAFRLGGRDPKIPTKWVGCQTSIHYVLHCLIQFQFISSIVICYL